jgi:heme/copper-type cytochrome/quinol oxidase subunit 3
MEKALSSPAAQVIISVIPIVGIVIGGVVIFFYLLWRHRETALQIRTGTYLEKKFNLKLFALLTGLLLIGVGLVLTAVTAIIAGKSYTLLGGLIPAALGICLTVFYKLYPDSKGDAAPK